MLFPLRYLTQHHVNSYIRLLVTATLASYIFDYYIPLRGYAVAQLVEALRYKPKGGGFDSRWSHWNFSMT
jgi:hypothetical protein